MLSRTFVRARATFSVRFPGRTNLSTLAVLEQNNGALNPSSLSTLTAARQLGGEVHALVAGINTENAAATAAKVKGVSKVLQVQNEAYERGLPESFAPMVKANAEKGGYTHILAGHSAFGKNVMPRVAALMDLQMVSDAIKMDGNEEFTRPIYAGNAILSIKSTDKVKLVTVRGTAFQAPPEDAEGNNAPVEAGEDPKASSPTEWVGEELSTSTRPDLSTASRVVSGGRGLKSKEEFDRLIPPLADALGAAIGASRAAVDSGFADNSLQVGQTGKNVAPQLYFAAGISGAIQHLAGMKDSKVIACVNKDADAPIFQVADAGLVGDLFEVLPELTNKVKQ
ncbi:electron transfer flavo protein, alpha subunit [Piedraia hortae CBS 480.64]|uniref:Probable electron transfer flavoprotein subunit alpha n=1 Tax=Piedraia hortae CBS 480.64 TaxID=1314780 RepID=A0A6A7C4L4_9PEZI|nr:electron transfer flavo protein, alpha subunit [Piedraia hortae CBS 480.64]